MGGFPTTSIFALGSNFKEQLGGGGVPACLCLPPPPPMSIFALGANCKEQGGGGGPCHVYIFVCDSTDLGT